MALPDVIHTQFHTGGHIQGIALDRAHGFLYCSFTTELVKYDLSGNLLGSVGGLNGHLGCLAIAPDGRVFGSLEYKTDAIGRGILARTGGTAAEDGFYAAIFDGERITRTGMDACADGVMTAVHLAEVTRDYLYEENQPGGGVLRHLHGCSGIDGMTFAPAPGAADGPLLLHVAYGVYGDVTRADNDYQVILAYDTSAWEAYARPLDQRDMHRFGPAAPDGKYFVYTGNTRYGVQNLEYDPETGRMFMAVYCGKKPVFPNYPMYAADWNAAPMRARLSGFGDGTEGDVVPLRREGMYDAESGVFGWEFAHGSTGMICLGGGEWYFSCEKKDGSGFASDIVKHRFTGQTPDGFSGI